MRGTREAALRRFGRIDAFYSLVGISISLLELGLVSITLRLGQHGFELATISGMLFSVVLESIGGASAIKLGSSRTLLLGLGLKLCAHLCLFVAMWLSVSGTSLQIWTGLLISYAVGAIATGSIISAYRPAYANWYRCISNDIGPIDFMSAYAYSRWMRLLGPLLAMALAVSAVYAVSAGIFGRPELIGIYIVTIIVALRSLQLIWTYIHMKSVLPHKATDVAKIKNSVVVVLRESFITISGQRFGCIAYVFGNLVFLIVVTYFIGVIYRLSYSANYPLWLVWLGGSLFGVAVHSGASVVGSWLYPVVVRYYDRHDLVKTFVGLTGALGIFASGVIFFAPGLSIAVVLVVSTFFYVFGGAITRLVSEDIVKSGTDSSQSVTFTLLEIASTLALVMLLIVGLNYSGNGLLGIVSIMGLIATFGFIVLFTRIPLLRNINTHSPRLKSGSGD